MAFQRVLIKSSTFLRFSLIKIDTLSIVFGFSFQVFIKRTAILGERCVRSCKGYWISWENASRRAPSAISARLQVTAAVMQWPAGARDIFATRARNASNLPGQSEPFNSNCSLLSLSRCLYSVFTALHRGIYRFFCDLNFRAFHLIFEGEKCEALACLIIFIFARDECICCRKIERNCYGTSGFSCRLFLSIVFYCEYFIYFSSYLFVSISFILLLRYYYFSVIVSWKVVCNCNW